MSGDSDDNQKAKKEWLDGVMAEFDAYTAYRRSLALILYPDPVFRDPYGVITRGSIHQYAHFAEAFVEGWKSHAVEVVSWASDPYNIPPYWRLRDYVESIADIPPLVASQIALHYCAPARREPYRTSFFRPIV